MGMEGIIGILCFVVAMPRWLLKASHVKEVDNQILGFKRYQGLQRLYIQPPRKSLQGKEERTFLRRLFDTRPSEGIRRQM